MEDEEEIEDDYYEPEVFGSFEKRAMADRMRRLKEPLVSIYQEIS